MYDFSPLPLTFCAGVFILSDSSDSHERSEPALNKRAFSFRGPGRVHPPGSPGPLLFGEVSMDAKDLVGSSVAKILKAHKIKALTMLGMALPEMADAVIKAGKSGDVHAAEYILDRSFGKPSQEVTGKDGGPVEIVVKWDGNRGETPKT